MSQYLVRIGFAGDCFRGAAPEASDRQKPLLRGSEVLVQTPRGVELGEVLGESKVDNESPPGLQIIRRLTADDRLLVERLERYRRDAVRRCQKVLAASESSAVLLDVDQLFDGNTLVLHFLGPVDALGHELTQQIVAQYESEVQSIRLAELMMHGCGPDCGTEASGGCGSAGGCASCAVAGACGNR